MQNKMELPLRSIQPEIKMPDKISLLNYEVICLDNGIQVYKINTGGKELVKIEFLFSAGNWFEEKHLISKFTNKMLKEGTISHTSADIADRIDYFGAHLDTTAGKDMAYATLYTLNKHISSTLPILAEVLKQPVFPQNELNRLIQNQKQKFIVNNEKVRYLARRKFNNIIFGTKHPYGSLFREEDFDKISRSDLVSFHKKQYTANNCKIIVSGMVSNDLINLLNKYFNDIQKSESDIGDPVSHEINPGKKMVHIRKDKALQSAIRIGKVLFNKKHPDYLSLKVLNTVLGGYFGSRLMNNIRENKGYTYGIGSGIVSLHNTGYFFITSEVGSDVTQKAIDEVYHEIKLLQDNKIPEDELILVKNYMLGSFLRSIDGAFSMAESLKGIIEYDLDNNYYKNFLRTINSVSSSDLVELAQKYLDPGSMYELRVGK